MSAPSTVPARAATDLDRLAIDTIRTLSMDAVEAAMPAANLEGFDPKARTVAYLKTTLGTVIPFYRLEKA